MRDANVVWLDNLSLPYDTYRKEREKTVRIVEGSNVCVYENRLRLRPGLADSGLPELADRRIDRMVTLETFAANKYIIVSAYNSSTGCWEVWYINSGAATPTWTQIDDLRDIHASTRPHEFLAARGRVFIKGYTTTSISTVQFDGTSTDYWGLDKPTQPARRTDPSTWSASANPVTVLFGWKYAYSWKSRTGHVSCRSPLEFDPSQQPSDTGAFTDKIPQITVRGHADTTKIPKIITVSYTHLTLPTIYSV